MTVQNTAISISGPYNTDGSTTEFDIGFQYLDDANIVYTLLNKTTNVVLLGTLHSDFEITDNVSPTIGGKTFVKPNAQFGSGAAIANGSGQIPTGYTVTLSQKIPFTQKEGYPEAGIFPSAATEFALDKLTLMIQQLAGNAQYSLQAPVTDVNPNMFLPIAAVRANKFLAFDVNGNPIAVQSIGTYRGVWVTATLYNFGDIITDGVNGANTGNLYFCSVANTSGVWATDLAAGDWTKIIDVQAFSAGFNGSSTTSNVVGTGAKSFTASTGKLWTAGAYLKITSSGTPANSMVGTVTSYNSATGALVMNITTITGTGTNADWLITLTGSPGASGTSIMDINGLTANTSPALTSYFPEYNGTANDKVALGDLFKVINAMTYQGSPSGANDALVIYNSSTSAPRKIALQDLFKTVIPGFSSKTTPVNADIFAMLDSAASNNPVQVTFANLKAAITAGSSQQFSLLAPASSASAGSTSLAFTGLIGSGYDKYLLLFMGMITSGASRIDLQYSLDNGSTWTGQAGTQTTKRSIGSTTATVSGVAIGTTAIQLISVSSGATDYTGCINLNIPSSGDYPYFDWKVMDNTNGAMYDGNGQGSVNFATPFTAVRLVCSAGTFQIAKALLYGVKNT